MGNVNMEAKQIHDRTEAGKRQSVADHLKALDAVAQQIENLPTFTSNDKAFLEGLPAFPSEDGSKVLTATTSGGNTNLSYGEIPNELPADPATDGTKVLTATTESGETTLSWEDPASGTVDYSTNEVNTGYKWIDGKDIYQKTIEIGTLPSSAGSKKVASGLTNVKILHYVGGASSNAAFFPFPNVSDNAVYNVGCTYDYSTNEVSIQVNGDRSAYTNCYVTLYYTKTTV